MKNNKLWILFKSMFLLSACTFGGGFVIVSLMKKKFVEELEWLDEDEMLDVTAITQSAPGPLPVNASVIIGYRMAGILGSVVAIIGTILPPMIIISIISLFYEQFRSNQYIAVALEVMIAGLASVMQNTENFVYYYDDCSICMYLFFRSECDDYHFCVSCDRSYGSYPHTEEKINEKRRGNRCFC